MSKLARAWRHWQAALGRVDILRNGDRRAFVYHERKAAAWALLSFKLVPPGKLRTQAVPLSSAMWSYWNAGDIRAAQAVASVLLDGPYEEYFRDQAREVLTRGAGGNHSLTTHAQPGSGKGKEVGNGGATDG